MMVNLENENSSKIWRTITCWGFCKGKKYSLTIGKHKKIMARLLL